MLCVGILCLYYPNTMTAADGHRDLASETRAVFAAKCAVCHGPDLAKPKGRFGYVTDLARVARNREMVVPSSPEESELWELVRRDEMPPADSPVGPLSTAQKEIIRAWIAAGAPPVADEHPRGSEEIANAAIAVVASPGLRAVSAEDDLLRRLGPLHVVVIHFPIALLLAAGLAELGAAWRGRRVPSPTVRFCVQLGTVSAVAAAALGWLHAANGYGSTMPLTLSLHRWLGTAAALWAIGTMALAEVDQRRGARSQWFRVWLFFGAALVAATGHFGGILVHGPDFLSGQ
jgi:mono/diheme cytochrome c family protein